MTKAAFFSSGKLLPPFSGHGGEYPILKRDD